MRPDTELTVIVTDPDGRTKTLDSNARDPGDRPRGISFSTQQASGFYTASFTLSRPFDRDNTDIGVYYPVTIVGANGEVAYEGFVTELPRSTGMDGHTLSVTCAGWMASTADEPFTEVFVDRDLGAWGPAGTARKANLLGAFGAGQVTDPSTSPDSLDHALRTAWTGASTSKVPFSEAWYDAGPGCTLGQVTVNWLQGPNVNTADANWHWHVLLSTDDTSTSVDDSGNLRGAGPGVHGLAATTADRRYAILRHWYNTFPFGVDGLEYGVDWRSLAAYGNQGIPLLGTAAPYGVAASDVIRYLVGRYAPMLNTAGVMSTTYPIAHLVFKTDTSVYDAMLKVNSYHQWQLLVYEDRTLHFGPVDLTEWDWEIRHDEMGNTIGLQGESATDLRNGIVVLCTNAATGRQERLTPDDHAELRDDSIDNPANMLGRRVFGTPFEIPFPTTQANALELGRLRLIEDNRPKAPGQFTASHYVRDRAGVLQPAWQVRAGDRIRITSSPNVTDAPRLIGETTYSHDSRSVSITVDGTARVIDAFLDRMDTALLAAGLKS